MKESRCLPALPIQQTKKNALKECEKRKMKKKVGAVETPLSNCFTNSSNWKNALKECEKLEKVWKENVSSNLLTLPIHQTKKECIERMWKKEKCENAETPLSNCFANVTMWMWKKESEKESWCSWNPFVF